MPTFETECVCGGSTANPNPDCERCQLVAEIARLKAERAETKPRPCRHRHCWVIVTPGGQIYWCYECGALRDYWSEPRWIKPVGVGGENPAMKRLNKEAARS